MNLDEEIILKSLESLIERINLKENGENRAKKKTNEKTVRVQRLIL